MYFHPKDEYIYYLGDCDIKQRLTDRSASHFGRFAPQTRPLYYAICREAENPYRVYVLLRSFRDNIFMCSKLLNDAADLQGSKFGIIFCTQPDVSDNSLSGSNLDLYRREAITMEDKITIHQLAGKLVAELKKCGFSECTI